MNFTRSDHAADLLRLRASRKPDQRAIGDNCVFEENLGAKRVAHFEAFDGDDPGLIPHATAYFLESIQGSIRTHIPSTFEAVNAPALMSAGIEPNQRITRLECIDDALNRSGTDFAALQADPRDAGLLGPLLRIMNGYPGARPAFACFRAEVAGDLKAPDWLPRLIARLGLGHFAVKSGETKRFALMSYLARDVIESTALLQPFAIPTVLDGGCNSFFFPAPPGQGFGYAVDLDPAAKRDFVREFLHMRITWDARQVDRFGEVTGPNAPVALPSARDAHLHRLRTASGRPNYGETMSPHVDP